ncbi:hypothetical protein RJT34_14381 [Clitoria ternatea]|uniref:Uncharacterized protein n=1 Tax=Clitoria ternatea TaxID=43366 RepID=A0AAN9JTU9_CLITE
MITLHRAHIIALSSSNFVMYCIWYLYAWFPVGETELGKWRNLRVDIDPSHRSRQSKLRLTKEHVGWPLNVAVHKSYVQTLNIMFMHKEARIIARTEDEQVIHPNPASQLKSWAPNTGVPYLHIMGCISSKVLVRSISLHEDRKERSQKTANGIPLLEDLIISTSGSDQYLALVCAANTVSNKLHSRSISSNRSSRLAIEPAGSETPEKLEPSERQGQGERKQIESDIKKNRSKSWHQFPEPSVCSLAQENSSGFEDKHDLSSKGAVRSRSFHTVEEYDEMVNKICLTKSYRDQQSEFDDDDDSGNNMKLQVSEFISNTEDKDCAIKKMQPSCLNRKCSIDERKIVKEIHTMSTTSTPESCKVTLCPESHISNSGNKNEEVVPSDKIRMLEGAAQGEKTNEKGNKRKAVAKRLESLRIPSSIEYPAIASLREWHPAGGIYSPGSYITPKFGSYSIMNIRNANKSIEDSVFSPELVSAFEQCMVQLEAEEENILKQIVENVEEESEGSSPKKELHHA